MEKQLADLAELKQDEVELVTVIIYTLGEDVQMVIMFGSYVYGSYIDEAVRMSDRAGNDYYYAHDHLYSPAALIDNSGAVVERYEYNSYGDCNVMDDSYVSRTGSSYSNPYLFTGRRLDVLDSGDLKIMYNRARYYDPNTGRFLTHDPAEYVDGFNLYEYVRSNPIRNFDPFGLRCGDCTPPLNPDKNAYNVRIKGFGKSIGAANPGTVQGLKENIAAIEMIMSLAAVIEGAGAAYKGGQSIYSWFAKQLWNKNVTGTLRNKALEGVKWIERNLYKSDMRWGWYFWAEVEYDECVPCRSLNPWLRGCATYEWRKAKPKWHWGNSGVGDGTIPTGVSFYAHRRAEAFLNAIRNAMNSALNNPRNPKKPGGVFVSH